MIAFVRRLSVSSAAFAMVAMGFVGSAQASAFAAPAAAPPAAAPAPAPPAAAPAPAPTPTAPAAPVVIAPAPAPTVVAPAPAAPAPTVIVTQPPAPPAPVVVVNNANDDVADAVVVETDDDDEVEVIEVEDDDAKVRIVVKSDDDDEEVEVEIEETVTHHHHHLRWVGLTASTVFSPIPSSGSVDIRSGPHNANAFRACLKPAGKSSCGYVKGFDFKLTMFESHGSKDYPWAIGYFRTGFTAGRADIDPGAAGFASGQTNSVRYTAVPLFFGGSFYAFGDFPVRPYAGLGAGFDILRLDYRRHDQARRLDASARIGFELHAGLEARITNFVAIHAEVMQLWSARRKLADVPDFSNTGLSVLAGVSVAIPTNLDEWRESTTHRKTKKTTRRRR